MGLTPTTRQLIPALALVLAGTGTLLAAPAGNAAERTAAPSAAARTASDPAAVRTAAHPPAVRTAFTPPMGWSSWSLIRSKPTERNIEAQGLAMHTSGLEAHGYRYVNIDAGWSDHLDAYGRWAWNTTSFPDGIPAVASYLHHLGLKFGIYLTPGIPKAAYDANLPIAGTPYHLDDIADPTQPGNTHDDSYRIDYSKPGAQEYIDGYADMLASWGVDYIKMDFVGPGGGLVPGDQRPDIAAWHQALQHTGHPINLELSNSLSLADAPFWKANSNGWRIDGDIECYHCTTVGLTDWSHVLKRFTDEPQWVPYGSRGGWNDLDSLEVGNGVDDGLTPDERQTAMTLWAISAAPLLLGTDLTDLDPADLKMLTND
jgi:alpha-galactosidase